MGSLRRRALVAAMGSDTYARLITAQAPIQWLDETTPMFQDAAGTTPAVANGDRIGRWDDRSGNGYNVVQATADLRPTLTASALNGKRGSTADNTSFNQSLSAAVDGTGWTSGFTAILVVTKLSNDSTKGVWEFSQLATAGTPLLLCQSHTTDILRLYYDSGYRNSWTVTVGTSKAIIVTADGTTWRVWLNGVQQAPYSAGLTNLANAQNTFIHTGFLPASDSRIMETVLFNKALTVAQVDKIAPLLNRKWDLS